MHEQLKNTLLSHLWYCNTRAFSFYVYIWVFHEIIHLRLIKHKKSHKSVSPMFFLPVFNLGKGRKVRLLIQVNHWHWDLNISTNFLYKIIANHQLLSHFSLSRLRFRSIVPFFRVGYWNNGTMCNLPCFIYMYLMYAIF